MTDNTDNTTDGEREDPIAQAIRGLIEQHHNNDKVQNIDPKKILGI